jgi:hypothetical protein
MKNLFGLIFDKQTKIEIALILDFALNGYLLLVLFFFFFTMACFFVLKDFFLEIIFFLFFKSSKIVEKTHIGIYFMAQNIFNWYYIEDNKIYAGKNFNTFKELLKAFSDKEKGSFIDLVKLIHSTIFGLYCALWFCPISFHSRLIITSIIGICLIGLTFNLFVFFAIIYKIDFYVSLEKEIERNTNLKNQIQNSIYEPSRDSQ